ncbi:MAG: Ig-like domain-containing protein, partial [Candidatus Zixiibacteriota bacterium]
MKQIIITLTLLGILISFGYAEELPIRILNDEPIILDEPVSLRSTPNLITGCCEIISYWGILGYYWRIPNDFTDDFYNQRFTPNLPGWLSNVSIIVYEPGSIDVSGLGIDVIVWDDDGTGLPGNELARINVPASEIIYYPDWTIVDFSSLNLNFYNDFHIGYTVVDKVNDTYSILSDKGNSGSMRSSVWWNGSWYYIFEHHNIDVNFIIKAELCHFPFHILSVSPAQNTLDVPVNTDISVNFCTDMLSSSINNTTFKVYGRSSGFHQGTISYDNEPQTLTATFDPLEDFQVGEVVTVTLTPGMYTHAGDLITTSY